ncbi:MAG: GNAT family N-acetyltransferase [Rhodobacteraceae bacterium]|nr:GNAT family N-acetyltransferase [Paracoccaceae bacterium]
MTPQELSIFHRMSFIRPRAWSADEFAAVLGTRGAFLLTEGSSFLLGRALAGEAELLTVAVPAPARRQGTGRRLLRRFQDHARRRGAREAFLEVASDNAAACGLYLGEGWFEAGRRRSYFGPGIDALVLRRDLRTD